MVGSGRNVTMSLAASVAGEAIDVWVRFVVYTHSLCWRIQRLHVGFCSSHWEVSVTDYSTGNSSTAGIYLYLGSSTCQAPCPYAASVGCVGCAHLEDSACTAVACVDMTKIRVAARGDERAIYSSKLVLATCITRAKNWTIGELTCSSLHLFDLNINYKASGLGQPPF